ncbi:unnamed protein product [Cyprideis torosa]|uniref:Uncharacterized protein n=1 Tax=Cyprideis torosa TaxID=163714 RepID=A0A7R8WLL9_9CRUS|nr:unnamed protein product [Cyprideis torosa]CAG0904497.1 unnamed protein product [Cyprideis torosa]
MTGRNCGEEKGMPQDGGGTNRLYLKKLFIVITKGSKSGELCIWNAEVDSTTTDWDPILAVQSPISGDLYGRT